MELPEQKNQEVELVYLCRLVSGNSIHFTTALLLLYYCMTNQEVELVYLSSVEKTHILFAWIGGITFVLS